MAGPDVIAQVYHTTNSTVVHAVGSVYTTADDTQFQTVLGCGFARPTAWSSIVVTGATAGIPGTWTPTGANPPDKFANMTGLTASPATAWTTGQYVLLDDASKAYWNGTAWVAGTAP